MCSDVIGMIHLYTGDGKGKTTAAFGLALRNVGWGGRVLVIQFLKGAISGELNATLRLPSLEIKQYGTGKFLINGSADEKDRELAREGLEEARVALSSGEYSLVVLDEINVAVHLGLLEEKEVLEVIKSKDSSTEVVLTGRYAPKSFYDLADYITEFVKIKHPYDSNARARRGIDY
ncbi:MAG: cob(I)yrinic acid a,c-diamide adenosyltransferase [Candidatus Korarchaeum sp.]|nr:cob(I)yrinic acid a,c-diamide adenosyltransferase [Candidatus Korarchaeum sp.]MDW8036231.1 cob(I)yrinic acid a,c-diamide adenosyltransferase [Candidatus Korarchaeum sp.]